MPSHFLNNCWRIIAYLGSYHVDTATFIQENEFQIAVWVMTATLSGISVLKTSPSSARRVPIWYISYKNIRLCQLITTRIPQTESVPNRQYIFIPAFNCCLRVYHHWASSLKFRKYNILIIWYKCYQSRCPQTYKQYMATVEHTPGTSVTSIY